MCRHTSDFTDLVSEEPEEEMTEAEAGSNEGPSEETEDLESLEPDDRGEKVSPAPAFLSRPGHRLLEGGSQPSSVSLSARRRGGPGQSRHRHGRPSCGGVGKAWAWGQPL